MASQVCAELLLVQLPEPARHRDSSTPQGATLQEYYDTVQKIPGVQHVYWSPRVEDPSKALITIIWDSFSVAEEGAKHPTLGPVLYKTAKILAAPPTILYITPPVSPCQALDCSATEVFIATFPPSISDEVKKAWEPAMPTLLREGKAESFGMKPGAEMGGWMAPGIPYSKIGEEGSTAWVHFVGWSSVDKHTAFRASEGFKENVGLIRNKGQAGSDMFHVLKV